MKKILISFGILIILSLVVLWLYLLSPNEAGESRFALFNFDDTTDENVVILPPVEDDNEPFFSEGSPLRQLTTKPVVGYGVVQKNASSSPELYYVEAGTSHVYSVDTETYTEKRVSNSTVTNVEEAAISKDGRYVVLSGEVLTILELPATPDGEVQVFTIRIKAESFTIIDDALLYLVLGDTSASVQQYTLHDKLPSEELFTIPFRETVIAWGNTVTGPHYFYPKPAPELLGYLYSVKDGIIRRENVSGYGLDGIAVGENFAFTTSDDYSLKGYVYDTSRTSNFYVNTIIDKCDSRAVNRFACAIPEELSNTQAQQRAIGKSFTTDNMSVLGINNTEVGPIIGVSSEAGMNLDVTEPVFTSGYFLFKNKQTGYLWSREL